MTDATPDTSISLTSFPVITDAVHNAGMILTALLGGILHATPAAPMTAEIASFGASIVFAGLSMVHVARQSWLSGFLGTLSSGGFTTSTTTTK